jgi:IS30 family transposase
MTGRPRIPRALEREFWVQVPKTSSFTGAAVAVGVSNGVAARWVAESGGVKPQLARSTYRISLEERCQIEASLEVGMSIQQIAAKLGRAPSTISREIRRNLCRGSSRRGKYLARNANAKADREARRPKTTKLADNQRLREWVQDRLEDEHSPEEISHRLVLEFPDDLEMRVSQETIYKELFVQSRGSLKRDLAKRLRTGRTVRKPRRSVGERRGRIAGMVSISERPAEVEDRAVPGHWEGDLIMGSVASNSAIGTVIERTTRFALLLHLPDGHGADAVEAAISNRMSQLPLILRKTLTWDQGTEMTNHARIAAATDLDIYFCDPASPWQRGSNENFNKLSRQYFPKSTDLSVYQPDYLDHVERKLNNRPRKTLNWKTPAEALDELLSNPPGVAFTA